MPLLSVNLAAYIKLICRMSSFVENEVTALSSF